MAFVRFASVAALSWPQSASAVDFALRGHQPSAPVDSKQPPHVLKPNQVMAQPVVTTTPRDRLSDSCEEPKTPPRIAKGEGPVEVFCCHTAKAKVDHFLDREKDCKDAVPCSKSWQEMLPAYLDYYTGLKEELCRTTTTTTSTTTTTTTVATTTTSATEEEEDEEEEKEEKPEPKEEPKDPLAWCLDPCVKHATDDKDKCKAFCEVIDGKVADKMKAAGCEASSSSSTKTTVTKVTKTTSDGKTTVKEETKTTESKEASDGEKKTESKEESKEEAADEEPKEEDAKASEEESGSDETADADDADEPKDGKADE